MKTILKISLLSALFITLSASASDKAVNQSIKRVSFNIDDRDYTVSFNCPKEFKDSVFKHDNMLSVILGNENNKLTISYTNIKLNDKELNYLKDEKHFKDSILTPFSDKENLLYGQYELINEKYSDNHYSIILTGFLKKPEDGYLPDTENHFYQRTDILFNDFHRISCQVSGRQSEAATTKLVFNGNLSLCRNIIDSFKVEHKASK